jgi:uncharacterized membrane protein YqaE (UPF0057 family)
MLTLARILLALILPFVVIGLEARFIAKKING